MARGYEGAFGRKVNAPYVWLPLCAIFVLLPLDWRRPLRVAHLDLLVIVAGFGVSHYFFNRGRSGSRSRSPTRRCSTCWPERSGSAFRGGDGLRPSVPALWLAIVARRPDRLPGRPQRRRLERDRRRLLRRDRRATRSPTASRSTATSPTTTATATPTARSPTTSTSRSSSCSPGRGLGRPAGRPRRGDLLRPGDHRRRSSCSAAACAPAETATDLGILLAVRLGRLPLHGLRPGVEHERRPGRDAAGRQPCSS